jgi:hypothetical protein
MTKIRNFKQERFAHLKLVLGIPACRQAGVWDL